VTVNYHRRRNCFVMRLLRCGVDIGLDPCRCIASPQRYKNSSSAQQMTRFGRDFISPRQKKRVLIILHYTTTFEVAYGYCIPRSVLRGW